MVCWYVQLTVLYVASPSFADACILTPMNKPYCRATELLLSKKSFVRRVGLCARQFSAHSCMPVFAVINTPRESTVDLKNSRTEVSWYILTPDPCTIPGHYTLHAPLATLRGPCHRAGTSRESKGHTHRKRNHHDRRLTGWKHSTTDPAV